MVLPVLPILYASLKLQGGRVGRQKEKSGKEKEKSSRFNKPFNPISMVSPVLPILYAHTSKKVAYARINTELM